jgi:hypothetical protein
VLPQADECRLEQTKRNGLSSSGRKEAGGMFIRRVSRLSLLSVAGEHGGQAFTNGEQPGLEEFCAQDGKHAILEVDVARA